MSDLINRQDAIDVTRKCSVKEVTPAYMLIDKSEIMTELMLMPSAEPEPQWILCSERLPEDKDYDETFSVTIQCEHVDGWDDYVTGYADWTPHGWDIQSYYLGRIKVTAWMPLPEPYQPKEE